jgi:hypothetical protein
MAWREEGTMFYGEVEGTGFVTLDRRFEACFAGHVRVERPWTGARWADADRIVRAYR